MEPHDAVHAANYSGNKGLGTSHIVYCNVRGKIIRVSKVLRCRGCGSCRATLKETLINCLLSTSEISELKKYHALFASQGSHHVKKKSCPLCVSGFLRVHTITTVQASYVPT